MEKHLLVNREEFGKLMLIFLRALGFKKSRVVEEPNK